MTNWFGFFPTSHREFQQTYASVLSTSKMVSQHFLHALNLGLTQKPRRKSRLGSYFAAHREFQEEYREPSSSPETHTSSGYPSTTTQLCNRERPLSLVYDSSDPVTNKPAKRRYRGDGLRKPSYKGPEKGFTDNANSISTFYSHTPQGILTHFGEGPRHMIRLSTPTPRDQNGSGSSTTTTNRSHTGNADHMRLSTHITSSYWRGGHNLRNTRAREQRAAGESVYLFRHHARKPV